MTSRAILRTRQGRFVLAPGAPRRTAKIVGAAGYKEFDPKLYEQEYARQDVRAQC
jgi:hypothetical protein